MRTFSIIIVSSLILSPSILRAQDEDPTSLPSKSQEVASPIPSSDSSEKRLVRMDYHDVDLKDVIGTIAEITKRNFIFGSKVQGKVTIVSPEPVTVEDAYQAFLSALSLNGFSTVEEGPLTKIIKKEDARRLGIPVRSGPETNMSSQFVTQILPLKYVNASEAYEALRRLVNNDGHILAYGPTNSLIITDQAANISRLIQIIEKLDKQGFSSTPEIIPLKHRSADEMAEQLLNIFEAEGKSRRSSRIGVVDASASISKIIPDNRTNSLLVVANKEGLTRILDLLYTLDRKIPSGMDRGRVHIKRLKYANAEDLAELLGSLLGGGSNRTKKKTSKASSPTPSESTEESPFGEAPFMEAEPVSLSVGGESGSGTVFENEIRVVADPATNSLIVTASPSDYQSLLPIIDELDSRRPQVFVETLIMEVNLNSSLDVQLSGHGAGAGQNLGIFGQTNFGLTPLSMSAVQKVTDLASKDVTGGLVLGTTSNQTFKIPGTKIEIPIGGAMFKALQTNNIFNVLSAPNILTTDNKKAEILVGRVIPIQVGSNKQSDGTWSYQTQREKVGIQLAVTPQINDGDQVTLEIEQKVQEVENPEPSNSMIKDVTTSERSAKTTIVAQDGQTMALGGLIRDEQKKTVSKVPLLGDIPLIGQVFRSTVVQKEKRNLLIFLTPHIVREPEDMTRVSVKKNRERQLFNKKHGVGENPSLYDYHLDEGLNMAPKSSVPSAKQQPPKKRFNFETIEEEESMVNTEQDTAYRRAPQKNKTTTEPAYVESEEDEEEDSPRSRLSVSKTSSSGNPFAEIRPPSSD